MFLTFTADKATVCFVATFISISIRSAWFGQYTDSIVYGKDQSRYEGTPIESVCTSVLWWAWISAGTVSTPFGLHKEVCIVWHSTLRSIRTAWETLHGPHRRPVQVQHEQCRHRNPWGGVPNTRAPCVKCNVWAACGTINTHVKQFSCSGSILLWDLIEVATQNDQVTWQEGRLMMRVELLGRFVRVQDKKND